MRNIQIIPAVPPSTRPILATVSEASQDPMRIMENPNIDVKSKSLWRLACQMFLRKRRRCWCLIWNLDLTHPKLLGFPHAKHVCAVRFCACCFMFSIAQDDAVVDDSRHFFGNHDCHWGTVLWVNGARKEGSQRHVKNGYSRVNFEVGKYINRHEETFELAVQRPIIHSSNHMFSTTMLI